LVRNTYLVLFLLYLPVLGTAQHAALERLSDDVRTRLGEGKSIYQAPNGLMWFGMKPGGLHYYNGDAFVHVPLEDEVKFTAREEVFVVGDDILYLNFENQVKVFDPLTQQIVDSIDFGKDILPDGSIMALDYAEVEGEPWLWAALPALQKSDKAYYRILLSKNHRPFEWVTDGVFSIEGYSAMEPLGGELLLKTKEGFVTVNQDGKLNKQYKLPNYYLKVVKEGSLVTNQKDKIIFATYHPPLENNTLYAFAIQRDSLKLEFEYEKDDHPKNDATRLEVKDNLLFFNDYFVEVRELDQYKKKFYRGKDPGKKYTTLLDSMGTYWFGDAIGVSKRDLRPPVFRNYPMEKGSRMIAEDDEGKIYVGEDTRLIRIIDPAIDSVYKLSTGGEKHCFSVVHHGGKLYSKDVVYENGKIAPLGVPELETLKDGPLLQMIDRQGRLWTVRWGLSPNILVIDLNEKKEPERILIPNLQNVRLEYNSFYQRPSDGTIWLATQGAGAFVFSEDGVFIEQLSASSESRLALESNIVSCFYEDERGRLWIGHGKGISCLEPGGEDLFHFKVNIDEPDFNLVYGILPEQDDEKNTRFLWLSTNRGIYRFDTEKERAMGFPLHPEIMGTEFNRMSFHKAKNGCMYFGSHKNGVFAFFPEEVMAVYEEYSGKGLPILVNHFSKFDGASKEVIEPFRVPQNIEQIKLRDDERYFDLSFTVADFRKPEQNIYTYKLEGYDEDWRTPSRTGNKVHYENLSPGKYTLYLRGGLFHSALPYNEKQIKIIVLPPWHQSWWAIFLFSLAGLGVIIFLYRFQLKRQLEMVETRQIRELDELKTRFYTNITHEFRTPLTVMLGVSESISGHEKERKLIRRNGEKLLKLINQLLDLSKLEGKKLEVKLIHGDILPYLQYLTESFSSLATNRGIDLIFRSEVPDLFMDYDDEKIQQIVYNIVSNAIKFTHAGGKVIVEVERLEGKKSYLEIKISDNGIGVAPDKLPHIFDRFYQADNTITRQGEGTGIGLAFTKELVHLLGGHISVSSELGKGSTFTIQIPITTSAQGWELAESKGLGHAQKVSLLEKSPIKLASEEPENEIFPSAEKPMVLVVEDNEDVFSFIERLLSGQYQVNKAVNGQEGIDKALELLPDIIITDVMMPIKDGYELCATLKNDARTSHVPIIMLTAKVTEEDRFTGLRQGADAYLFKPFNKEELFIRLEKLLELRQALQKRYAQAAEGSSSVITIPIDDEKARPSLDDQFMQKIREIIDEKIGDPELDIAYICREVQLSSTQLFRKMKALTGMAPLAFVRKVRLHRAKALLESTDLNIAEIAYELGFTDPNYFSRAFKKAFGDRPSKVRG
jgi:signal transduction histidine kinase/CheY-like chemotaxis protein